jgi:NAD(P)-dependent dehydrogenase (short-subunit alcohol dehydrogenase family)
MKVLITGASRGIGRALAQHYTAAGAEVIGTARTPPDDDGFRWLPLDVTDPAAHRALARRLEGEALDLLVCNAGVYLDKHGQRLENGYAPALWAETFAVNVTGVFLTVQALLGNLRAAEAAKVGILSSQMGSSARAGGGHYIYRASKAAVLNLGMNLAADLAPEGIPVGIYHPGWVATEMGGRGAALTPEGSAAGLVQCLEALSPRTSGAFLNWDGRPHPV